MSQRTASSSPTVTALRELRGSRVEVELDGDAWRVLPANAVVRAGLRVGRELDRPLARELARELRRDEALTTAGRALRTRALSRRELEDRLERRGVGSGARAEALETLARAGFVDDGRFARGRAESLAARGYGDAAIRNDLERRGVAAEGIEDALASLQPERDRAARVVRGAPARAAAARRLATRGFGEEAIEAVLGDLVAGEG